MPTAGALGAEGVAHGTCSNRAETVHRAPALIAVAFALPGVSESLRASTGRFRSYARNRGSPPLISRGNNRLHMPHTSTGVPSYSSLRRKIFSFHGFALRSKITKWPASAPHRSM